MALTALKMRNLLAHERTLPILILIFAASRLIIIPLVPLTPQCNSCNEVRVGV